MPVTYWLILTTLIALCAAFEICYRQVMKNEKELHKATPNDKETIANESV